MVAGEVISFRKEYRISNFPVAVQLYHCGDRGDSCRRTTQIIHSAQELREFQDELTKRESVGEWIFIVYCECNGTEYPPFSPVPNVRESGQPCSWCCEAFCKDGVMAW